MKNNFDDIIGMMTGDFGEEPVVEKKEPAPQDAQEDVMDMLVGDFNPNHDPDNGQFTEGGGSSDRTATAPRFNKGNAGTEEIANAANSLNSALGKEIKNLQVFPDLSGAVAVIGPFESVRLETQPDGNVLYRWQGSAYKDPKYVQQVMKGVRGVPDYVDQKWPNKKPTVAAPKEMSTKELRSEISANRTEMRNLRNQTGYSKNEEARNRDRELVNRNHALMSELDKR